MIEPRQFLDTVSLFATGVTVISAQQGDAVHGMTANAVTSLSLAPMSMIVCIAKKAKMAMLLQKQARFTINMLREDQEAISNCFAGTREGQSIPQFRFVEWGGGPRIEGCLAAIGCEVHELLDGGDHWIVIGRVVDLHCGIEPRTPLLYFNRRYHRIEPKISTTAPERLDLSEGEPQIFYDPW